MKLLRRLLMPGQMSCAQVQELVQSYLDGELDGRDRDRLAKHLDRCQPCGVEAETFQAIKRSLSAEPSAESVARLTGFARALPGEEGDA